MIYDAVIAAAAIDTFCQGTDQQSAYQLELSLDQ